MTLAREFGVSDVAVAKVCKKLDVPRPPRGYWARIEAGQKPRRPALPKPKKGTRTNATIAASESQSLTPTERKKRRPIIVAGESEPSSVREARASLRRAKPDASGLVGADRTEGLDIRVAPGSLERGLTILRSLIATVTSREHSLAPSWAPSGDEQGRAITRTCFVADLGATAFWLEERLESVIVEGGLEGVAPEHQDRMRAILQRRGALDVRRVDQPTGRLVLRVKGCDDWNPRTWSDGTDRPLEAQLGQVVSHIERLEEQRRVARERARRQLEERQAEERRQEVEARRREIAARHAKQERDVRDGFDAAVNAWEQARRRRAFLEAVVREVDPSTRSPNFDAWVAWASDYAARTDPLRDPSRFVELIAPLVERGAVPGSSEGSSGSVVHPRESEVSDAAADRELSRSARGKP